MDEATTGTANAAARIEVGASPSSLRERGSFAFIDGAGGLQAASHCHSDGSLIGAVLNV